MECTLISKAKYLITQNVYDNFVRIHSELNLLEKVPEYWNGTTVFQALEYLGIRSNEGIRIKSPIDEIKIYKTHIQHLICDNEGYRKKYLNRAIRTIQGPNLIIKRGVYNDYIKLFKDEKDKIKPHLQIVKVKSDGSFYVTNYKLRKNQFKKQILEGQIIYDLSSMSSVKCTDSSIITNISE